MLLVSGKEQRGVNVMLLLRGEGLILCIRQELLQQLNLASLKNLG